LLRRSEAAQNRFIYICTVWNIVAGMKWRTEAAWNRFKSICSVRNILADMERRT